MALSDVTSREAVLEAIAEFDASGRDAFLAKYGPGSAQNEVLIHQGRQYDSNAIIMAAHAFQHPDAEPFTSNEVSGTSTKRLLEALGFSVNVGTARPLLPSRAWKVAPGEGAEHWEDCLREGYIVVGWNELGDLSRFVGGNREEFLAEYARAYPGHSDQQRKVQSTMLWTFLNELRNGDLVVANRGRSVVVGIGEVTSDYEYRPERSTYRHVRRVRWFDDQERHVGDQGGGWIRTLVPIAPEKYAVLTGAAPAPSGKAASAVPSPGLVEAVRSSLAARGLHFGTDVLSSYILALQAKRFVILTGISGTGKTQLALALAHAFPVRSRVAVPDSVTEGSAAMVVRPYMLTYGHIVLPAEFSERIPRSTDEASKEVEFVYPGGMELVRLGRLKGERSAEVYLRKTLASWFRANMTLGLPFELEPVFREGGALQRLTLRTTTSHEIVSIRNHAVVEVRPDWTDSRGLLGYWNPITERYHAPAFLRLLLEAREEEERAAVEGRAAAPFFVVLDEMNLARVEHYFAELLSCFESDEPLKLHDDARLESGLGTDEELPIPRELPVPGNLFITGTVNIDETTHMFSPKVLDRAFVLELNDVDLRFLGGGAEGGLTLPRARPVLERDPRNRQAWDAFGALEDGELREVLLALHAALESHGRHFAYRVAFDVARFVVLADEQGGGTPATAWVALDQAVLAKVLPKLAGTQAELEALLTALEAICLLGAARSGEAPSPSKPEGLLPRSARKLSRMRQRLSQIGYCAFIA